MTVAARLMLATVLAVTATVAIASTAARRGEAQSRQQRFEPNVPYDGRFTFARIRYTVYRRGGWAADYPTMERNLMTMLRELTVTNPHVTGSNIHTFDDPELLKFPVAYLSEPGYWLPSDSEVNGLRTYLAKGGFLIVDDFMRREWFNFEEQMRRVLPNARIETMTVAHPIFDTFFRIPALNMTYPHDSSLQSEYFGIYEDNDPNKRLMVIINYNNDIGDYMEWSGEGWWPVNITNDAYKLAINYIIYGLTH